MNFEENKLIENLSEKVGFVFSYFVFTTVLFFILSYTNRLPQGADYFYAVKITLTIIMTGILLKYLLK